MSVDDTKLNYLSSWDIDQLVDTDTISVGSGATAVFTITSPLPSSIVYEIQFQPGDSGPWYQAGEYSTDGTLANSASFYTYINAGQLFINTPVTGKARYFVWSDKIDY